MALNLLDGIDPIDVYTFAKNIPTPENFALTRLVVRERTIQGVRYRAKNQSITRNTAKFRTYDAETPIGRRQSTLTVTEGILPPVGQKLVTNELETILLEMARGADNSALIEAVYDDMLANVIAIKSRMELAAGDLLTDGKFTLTQENGLTLEADFGLPGGNLLTPSILWDDSSGDQTPLSDEQAWEQARIDANVGRAGLIVTSNAVKGWLAKSLEYRQTFYGLGAGASQVPATLTPGQVDSVRATYGLPPLTVYDESVSVDGTLTRTLAANKFIRLPGDPTIACETQYGITAEGLALTRGGSGSPRITLEEAPGIIGVVMEEGDPVRVWSKATAVAMPVLYAPTYLQVATVIA